MLYLTKPWFLREERAPLWRWIDADTEMETMANWKENNKKWNSALSYLSSSPWAKGRKRHSKASLESQNHQHNWQIFVMQKKVITLKL